MTILDSELDTGWRSWDSLDESKIFSTENLLVDRLDDDVLATFFHNRGNYQASEFPMQQLRQFLREFNPYFPLKPKADRSSWYNTEVVNIKSFRACYGSVLQAQCEGIYYVRSFLGRPTDDGGEQYHLDEQNETMPSQKLWYLKGKVGTDYLTDFSESVSRVQYQLMEKYGVDQLRFRSSPVESNQVYVRGHNLMRDDLGRNAQVVGLANPNLPSDRIVRWQASVLRQGDVDVTIRYPLMPRRGEHEFKKVLDWWHPMKSESGTILHLPVPELLDAIDSWTAKRSGIDCAWITQGESAMYPLKRDGCISEKHPSVELGIMGGCHANMRIPIRRMMLLGKIIREWNRIEPSLVETANFTTRWYSRFFSVFRKDRVALTVAMS